MKRFSLLSLVILSYLLSCKQSGQTDPTVNAEKAVQQYLQLPSATFTLDPATTTVDNSITIAPNPGSGQMAVQAGVDLIAEIKFTAPNRNVVGAGIRFGETGPINFVRIPGVQGQASGTMNVPFRISPQTCAALSQICHDIRCYEFALTADGKITAANVTEVALACGKCDEPSCRGLVACPNTSTIDFRLDGQKLNLTKAGFKIIKEKYSNADIWGLHFLGPNFSLKSDGEPVGQGDIWIIGFNKIPADGQIFSINTNTITPSDLQLTGFVVAQTCNLDGNCVKSYDDAKAGSFTLKRTGSTYEITVDLTLYHSSNPRLVGSYKGPLVAL